MNNGYAVGTNNQMTSDGTYRYQYDAEGNRTRRFRDQNANGQLDSGDTDITEYTWDHRSRLVDVRHRPQYGAATDKIIENSYDYANRWTRKILDSDGDGTPDFRQVFAYDGSQIVLDSFKTQQSSSCTWSQVRLRISPGRAPVCRSANRNGLKGGAAPRSSVRKSSSERNLSRFLGRGRSIPLSGLTSRIFCFTAQLKTRSAARTALNWLVGPHVLLSIHCVT